MRQEHVLELLRGMNNKIREIELELIHYQCKKLKETKEKSTVYS